MRYRVVFRFMRERRGASDFQHHLHTNGTDIRLHDLDELDRSKEQTDEKEEKEKKPTVYEYEILKLARTEYQQR